MILSVFLGELNGFRFLASLTVQPSVIGNAGHRGCDLSLRISLVAHLDAPLATCAVQGNW